MTIEVASPSEARKGSISISCHAVTYKHNLQVAKSLQCMIKQERGGRQMVEIVMA